jgi:hypothetical protein
MKVINTWRNKAGQLLVEHETGISPLPSFMSVQDWLVAHQQRAQGRQDQAQVAEIERALPADCLAIQNVETGAVRVFAAPTTKTQERVPRQQTPEEELAALKKEAKTLQALIDNPATGPAERAGAQSRLAAVTVLIVRAEAARERTDTGMSRPVIQYEYDRRGARIGAKKA